MATRNASRYNIRRWMLWLGAVVAVLVLLTALTLPDLQQKANLGTAYGARIACSCHYVAGRSLEDCAEDFEPGMESVGLSSDEAERSVTASIFLLGSATARYKPGWGCLLDPKS